MGMRAFPAVSVHAGSASGSNAHQPSVYGGLQENDTSGHDYGVSVLLEAHARRGGSMSPYVAVGPQVRVSASHGESRDTYSFTDGSGQNVTQTNHRTDDQTATAIDGIAAIGTEWGVARAISIGGEYRVRVSGTWSNRHSRSESMGPSSRPPQTDSEHASGWSLDTDAAVFYFAVRW